MEDTDADRPTWLPPIYPQERAPLGWAAGWFFCVLGGYYTLRPVRETFATQLSSDQRANLFTATLLVMLLVTPLYGLIVSKVPRRHLVAVVYGFFVANIAVFWSFADSQTQWLSATFFVWLSVFNLFVVTLFWGTVVDLFHAEQGKRLFGLVFGAGTLGQLSLSWIVHRWTTALGMRGLLALSGLMLLAAIGCSRQLRKQFPEQKTKSQAVAVQHENTWTLAWQGVVAVFCSPYLLGIAIFIVTISLSATVVYFQMTDLVGEQLEAGAPRTQWFAKVNFWQGVATLVAQSAVVSWLLRKLGVGLTLALVPAIYCAGFATLTLTQSLAAIGLFQIALRTAAFSLGNPSLEVLFTAVAPEQKYRAKSFIDTVGKRTGDVAGAQLYALVMTLGWTIPTISLAMVPIVVGLIVLCLILGSAQQRALQQVEEKI